MSGSCEPANRIYIPVVACNLYYCGSCIFFYHMCLLPHFLLLREISAIYFFLFSFSFFITK